MKIIHFENTSRCNASCPMCSRNILGDGLTIKPDDLSLEQYKKYVNDNLLDLEKVFFCGNLGDPAADKHLLDKISWTKNIKENIVIGFNTNGSIRNPNWWRECAKLLNGNLDYVVFSIDGLEDTNQIYRVGVQWDKIIKNAEAYIQAGGSAHWDMLVFEHNKHQVDDCKNLANKMGFSWFRSKETDRWDQFTFEHLKPANEYNYIDYNRVNVIQCERNIDCSTFVDYKGQEFPCCYMNEMYYDKTQQSNHQDILCHTPEELMKEYQTRLDSGNPFYVCKRSCGQTVNKRSQWKQEVQLR